MEKKEMEAPKVSAHTSGVEAEQAPKIPFSRKLRWLNRLLFGGAFLLAFDHVWHGEIVPFFPFLTATTDPASTAEMLHEMATVGVTMAILCTVVWVGMLVVSSVLEKRNAAEPTETEEV